MPDNSNLGPGPTISGSFNALTSGSYVINEQVVWKNVCGTDTFNFADTFYLKINPNPVVNYSMSGDTILCLGSSEQVVLTINSITPNTSSTIFNISPNDTIVATDPGIYGFNIYVNDTITHCSNWYYPNFNINNYPIPFAVSNPSNGLICPNSTATITCTYSGASAYQWYGSTGMLAGQTNSTIIVSTPGSYYCIAMTSSGCQIGSNVVNIEQYNSPYIVSMPSQHLCPGQTATLIVVTNDSSQIHWLGSLSTYTNATVVVSIAGTYSCQATMCGITTTSSVQITASNPIAQITVNGSLNICPGDSVQLIGNSGMASYYWDPTSSYNQSFWTYQPGTYTLTTTDVFGCTAVSAPVTVSFNSNTNPPTVSNSSYTLCAGDSVTIQANGSGNIVWYLQQYGGAVFYTGNNLNTHPVYTNVTYYVAVSDTGNCQSTRVPINVTVVPSSLSPDIIADTLYCAGNTIQLGTTIINVTYNWTGPNGFSSNTQNPIITNCTGLNSGVYTLSVNGGQCSSQPAYIKITVLKPSLPLLSQIDSFCSGKNVTVQITNPINSNYSWYGPNGFVTMNSFLNFNPILIADSGNYDVFFHSGNCYSDTNNFHISVIPSPALSLVSDTSVCINDSIKVKAIIIGQGGISWQTPNGAFIGNPLLLGNAAINNSGWYYAIVDNKGCKNQDSIRVNVYNKPIINLVSDTFACNGTQIILTVPSGYNFYQWSDGSTLNNLSVSTQGLYSITVKNNQSCLTTGSIRVHFIDCNSQTPNVFSPNADGINDAFIIDPALYPEVHYVIYDRWGVLIFDQTNNTGWNGKSIFTNKDVSDGTYYFICDATDVFNKNKKLYGYVQLLR